jgi:glycosyltransferase involved in cell wall biosynthesis
MFNSIDVIIPAYNAELFIHETLLSIVNQSYLPNQIIIIDDGSKDRTHEVVEKFKANHPEIVIQYFKQNNAGPSAARNKGLEYVTANFVAFIDADDVWSPNKLSQQIKIYQNDHHHEIGLVYCDYGLINETGHEILKLQFQLNPKMKGHVSKLLRRDNYIAGSASAALVRMDALRKVGFFDESLVCAEDWDLWYRISEKYQIDFAPTKLVYLRQHQNNAQKNHAKMFSSELLFASKMLRNKSLSICKLLSLMRRFYDSQMKINELNDFKKNHFIIKIAMSNLVVFLTFFPLRATRFFFDKLNRLVRCKRLRQR